MADHEMRPGCALEFGKITESARLAEIGRRESFLQIEKSFSQIEIVRKEIMKLTGNGSRGRIDQLAEHTAVNTALLEQVARRLDKFEAKIWSMGLKVAGISGTIGIIAAIITAVLL